MHRLTIAARASLALLALAPLAAAADFTATPGSTTLKAGLGTGKGLAIVPSLDACLQAAVALKKAATYTCGVSVTVTVQAFITNCINANMDCHNHLLGDGRTLY